MFFWSFFETKFCDFVRQGFSCEILNFSERCKAAWEYESIQKGYSIRTIIIAVRARKWKIVFFPVSSQYIYKSVNLDILNALCQFAGKRNKVYGGGAMVIPKLFWSPVRLGRPCFFFSFCWLSTVIVSFLFLQAVNSTFLRIVNFTAPHYRI